MARPPNPLNQCAFCGKREKMSGEHVFAKWLQDVIPKQHDFNEQTRIEYTRGNDGKLRAKTARGKLHRPEDMLSQTLRCVCRKCNGGWMSQIVESAKPILSELVIGKWPILNEQSQTKLAQWATMLTMVAEFADVSSIATPYEDRSFFRTTKVPPFSWRIMLGRYNGATHAAFLHRAFTISPHPDKIPDRRNTQITAFVVGKVFFQTVSSSLGSIWTKMIEPSPQSPLQLNWPVRHPSLVEPGTTVDNAGIQSTIAATTLLLSGHRFAKGSDPFAGLDGDEIAAIFGAMLSPNP
jgi:hypothetical protein